MIRKFASLVFILVLALQPGFTGKVGKTGWTIFRKARSAKFKPITVTPVMAVRGDLSGVFYNPGVLALNTQKELFIMSELGMTEDMFGGAVYGHPVKGGCLAGGLVYYDAGKMELAWLESGNLKTNEVSAQRDILGLVSYGRRINDDFAGGITLKAATSELFEKASANAFAVDLGMLYFPPVQNVTVTASVQNLGSSSKFVEKANPLPLSAFLGAGYLMEFKQGWYLSPGFDLTYLFDEERAVPELGFETGRLPLSVNVGYRMNVEESVWHVGMTILKDKYDVSYSYIPARYLNATHRISVGFRFK